MTDQTAFPIEFDPAFSFDASSHATHGSDSEIDPLTSTMSDQRRVPFTVSSALPKCDYKEEWELKERRTDAYLSVQSTYPQHRLLAVRYTVLPPAIHPPHRRRPSHIYIHTHIHTHPLLSHPTNTPPSPNPQVPRHARRRQPPRRPSQLLRRKRRHQAPRAHRKASHRAMLRVFSRFRNRHIIGNTVAKNNKTQTVCDIIFSTLYCEPCSSTQGQNDDQHIKNRRGDDVKQKH